MLTFQLDMSEPFINKLLRQEAKTIAQRAAHCRKQLGAKGSTTTAIRLFGKIGSSVDESLNNSYDPATAGDGDKLHTPIALSPKTLTRSILEAIASSWISFLAGACQVMNQILVKIWHGIASHKILILGLFISCLFNLFLMGRSTQAYWSERHAEQYAADIGILPSSHSVMQRSVLLQDIDAMILNGSRFSAEMAMAQQLGKTSESQCYEKFQSLAILPDDGEKFFASNRFIPGQSEEGKLGLLDEMVPIQYLFSDQLNYDLRDRIYSMRTKLGIQRNSLMVELRLVNRLESELLMAEWQSWLSEEVFQCGRILQELVLLHYEQKYSPGVSVATKSQNGQSPLEFPPRLTSEKRSNISNILRSSSLEMRQFVNKYCQSCSRELTSLRTNMKEEKAVDLADI